MSTTLNTPNYILNPELLDGAIVEAKGFSFLGKMHDGKFRLEFFTDSYHGECFRVYKPRGSKVLVIHKATSVAMSVNAVARGDNNGLKLVSLG